MRYAIASMLIVLLPGYLVEVLTTTSIQGELAGEAAQSATRQLTQTQDQLSRQIIQQSINSYASLNGFFPETLEELVPDYLSEIPKTTDGQAFLYDLNTGGVRHPSQGWPNTSNNSTTTNTPRSGTAAGQIQNISAEHTRRQLEALDDLN